MATLDEKKVAENLRVCITNGNCIIPFPLPVSPSPSKCKNTEKVMKEVRAERM